MYKELPYNFLEIAKSDLSASKCLFNNKFYPQSLFFFQQSVEKAVKSFGISVGLLKDEKAVKIYSHKSSVVFIDLMKAFLELLSDQIILGKSENKELVDQFIKISKNNLNNYSDTNSSTEDAEIIKIIGKIKEKNIDGDVVGLILIYLSFLSMIFTSDVNESTRYPDLKSNRFPSMNYNENSILVKSFTELSNIMEEVLSMLKDYLENGEFVDLSIESLKDLINKGKN